MKDEKKKMKAANKLKLVELGIDTQHEHVVYMHGTCPVVISEGFEALTRIKVTYNRKQIIANLNVINSDLLDECQIGLSASSTKALGVKAGDMITVSHVSPVSSLSLVRSKVYGQKLSAAAMDAIIEDIVKGRYSNVQLAAFITACATNALDTAEIIDLTNAMIKQGNKLTWNNKMIVDKHCIGGLPGNRTTPIVVSIVTAYGLTMPKTSSRAITSPAGTADTMEVMTKVNLTIQQIEKVVNKEGGCIAWGGHASLSPADDILIRVEKALDLDTEGQLIASVFSKKAAAGSTHVVIDLPVGETAKLRNIESANRLKLEMEKVAQAIGFTLKVVITDGTQPVGRGIGPALEAMDVLSVLRNEENAPSDLRDRALHLAGEIFELCGKAKQGQGNKIASEILKSGKAYEKFMAICKAQGGFTEPEYAPYMYAVKATENGKVEAIDNRKLAKIAKLAGAPEDKKAGLVFNASLGTLVQKGQVLFTVYSESEGELAYALDYLNKEETPVIKIEKSI